MPTHIPQHLSKIFERADVYISINTNENVMVFKSYNQEAPLTNWEKLMVREFYEGVPYEIRFSD